MTTGNATIRRARKDADNPWRVMPRSLFEDKRISFDAKGVMGYILVKPDDWKVRVSDLRKVGGIGRDKAYKILDELIAAGYIERKTERKADGTIGDTIYLVHEEPLPEKPDTDKPDTAEPDTVNTEHTKEEALLTNDVTKEEVKRVAAATSPLPVPAEEEGASTEVKEWFGVVCAIVGWDSKTLGQKERGQVAQTLGIIRKAGYNLDELKQFLPKVWHKDWRWTKNQSFPTLSQLKTEIGKVRAQSPVQPSKNFVPPVSPTEGGGIYGKFASFTR